MLERELKLYIPHPQQQAVKQAVQQYEHQLIHLAARYFDTPQRELAQQGAALRLRLEGNQWVQTLKIRGEDALSNTEYNHTRSEPTLDLDLYKHTAAAILFEALRAPLAMRYETEVQRTTARIDHEGTQIELALDLGLIHAKQNQLIISELEFELKTGEMSAVFSCAQQWLKEHGLLLELRTKSERGDALYEQSNQAMALNITPSHATDTTTLYTEQASLYLNRVIRYAGLVAGLDEHQPSAKDQARDLMLMRVNLRGLRSWRQLFKPWLSQSEARYAKALHQYHKAFGQWRDHDMLSLELIPKLKAAGLPLPKSYKAKSKNPGKNNQHEHSAKLMASNATFQTLLLQSLAQLVLKQGLKPSVANTDLISVLLQRRMENWLLRIQKQSLRFTQLSPKSQHNLRNKIKRLRYNLHTLGHTETDPLYKALVKAQNRLGRLCDLYVTYEWYENQAASKTKKRLAKAWFEQKINHHKTKSEKALKLLQTITHNPIRLQQTH